MRRALSLCLTLSLLLTLAACGAGAGQGGSSPAPGGDAPDPAAPEMSPASQPDDTVPPEGEPAGGPAGGEKKILIACFSATGNTAGIAGHLDAILDADLYEITPEQPYTGADLDYNTDCRANREQNDPDARPAIAGGVEDMGQYDVIFLGYPIWWGKAPKIISTFLESYDFTGKTIVPFCTSGSSGIGSSAEELQDLAAGGEWLEGRRFSGGASAADVQSWVDSLDLET